MLELLQFDSCTGWYAPGRSGQHADDILKGFSGILQVDGYAGYNRLLKRTDDNVALAYCWAHARCKLHEVAQSGTTPIAEEGLRQIAALYRIEKDRPLGFVDQEPVPNHHKLLS